MNDMIKNKILAQIKRQSAVSTASFILMGVGRIALEQLERDGLIERDAWPNGSEYWRLKETT